MAGATVSCTPMIATPDTAPITFSTIGNRPDLHMQYAEHTIATPSPPASIRLIPAAAWSSASTPARSPSSANPPAAAPSP